MGFRDRKLDEEVRRQIITENKVKKDSYVFAGSYIVMGLIMIFFPQFTLEMICYLLAAILAVLGIFNLIVYFTRDVIQDVYRYDFVSGVMMLLVAIICVWRSELIIDLIPIVMGLIVFWNGVTKLQRSIDLKRTNYPAWYFVLIFALMSIAFGVVIIMQPEFIAQAVIIIIGISLVFGGVTDIITLILLGKQVKELKKRMPIDVDAQYISEDKIVDMENGDASGKNYPVKQ